MARKKVYSNLIPPAPNLQFERTLWEEGVEMVTGIDEAGRGALAGPVFAAAVILPPKIKDLIRTLDGVRDSKQMTAAQREHWSERLRKTTLAYGVGSASARKIDTHRILPATQLAIRRALSALSVEPEHLLVDYLNLPQIPIPQTSLVKGDARSLSIAAAAILAKTARDAHMRELDDQYPGYHLASNKGYGTAAHLAAIETLGPSPIHRRTFSPLKPRLS